MSDDRLYNQLDRIEATQADHSTELSRINVKLAKYNAELEFHVARTTQIEDEFVPIKAHIEQIKGALWVLGAIGGIAGFSAAIQWIWGR